MKTVEVVEEFIKPATRSFHCRYADLVSVRAEGVVAPAKAFLSHCWGGLFVDLVAAAAHALRPDDYCWIGAIRAALAPLVPSAPQLAATLPHRERRASCWLPAPPASGAARGVRSCPQTSLRSTSTARWRSRRPTSTSRRW